VNAFVNLPGGGTAVYGSSGIAYYRHADWLGSSRLASTPSQSPYSSTAYAPFGEAYGTAGTTDQNFTGMNSDTVSTLYDFPARRYNQWMGRWISPDPSGINAVDPTSPQTWNRYAYVANMPLTKIDPLGLMMENCGTEVYDVYINGAYSETQSVPVYCDVPDGGGALSLGGGGGSWDGIGWGPSGAPGNPALNAPSTFAAVSRSPKTPQQCQALANKINNVLKDIASSQGELNTNPLNLPQMAPGRAAGSVQGHQGLLGQKIQTLANLAAEYESGCGGGPPAPPTNGSLAPSPTPIIVPPIMPILPMSGAGEAGWGAILEEILAGLLAAA